MQRAQNLTWPCATCPYSAQDGLVSHGQTLLQSRMLLLQLASFFEIPKLIQPSFQLSPDAAFLQFIILQLAVAVCSHSTPLVSSYII